MQETLKPDAVLTLIRPFALLLALVVRRQAVRPLDGLYQRLLPSALHPSENRKSFRTAHIQSALPQVTGKVIVRFWQFLPVLLGERAVTLKDNVRLEHEIAGVVVVQVDLAKVTMGVADDEPGGSDSCLRDVLFNEDNAAQHHENRRGAHVGRLPGEQHTCP